MYRLISLAVATCCLACQHASAAESLFAEGSTWETVSKGHHIVEGIASLGGGTVYVTDVADNELVRIDPDGKETLIDDATDRANGLAFGPGGKLYSVCMSKPAVLVWDLEKGSRERIPLPSPGNDLAITAGGRLFYTWGKTHAVYELNLVTRESSKVADVENPNGITCGMDGRELFVGRFSSDTVLAFPILPGKGLGPAREAYKVKVPEDGKGLIDGMTPLADGKMLVSTALGLQLLVPDAEPVILGNPTHERANYVRLVTDGNKKRWIYAAHVKSIVRRAVRPIP